jgi:hypothetical protein
MAMPRAPETMSGLNAEERTWVEVIDAEAVRFYRDHLALVETLAELPAHQILGVAFGALAGAAKRMAVNPPERSRHSPEKNDAMQMLAEAGDACTTVLEYWLRNLFDDQRTSGVRMQVLGAFQAGAFASEQVGDEPHAESMPMDMRVATRVAGALMRGASAAPANATEPDAVEALLRDAECLPDETGVRIPVADGKVSQLECLGRVVKREGPYALLELDSVYNVLTGVINEPFEKGKDPVAVAVVREEFVRGLSEVPPRAPVRLKLESGLAGHVLTRNEVGEHPQFDGSFD